MHHIRSCVMGFFWLAVVCSFGGAAWAQSKTWSSQADWQSGQGVNVDLVKTPGNVKIFYDPAQQQYNETRFIYIPNSSLNTIVKMDTQTGAILWTYDFKPQGIGSSPSRTTVDSRGNVWVGLRDGSRVAAVDADGRFITSVNVAPGPRGVTVDRDGNVWAGSWDFGNSRGLVKINGSNYQVMGSSADSRFCVYGLTNDSVNGDIWISARCSGTVVKVRRSDLAVLGVYSAPGVYGIAADRVGNVWAASYENSVVYKFNAATGARTDYAIGARGRGVAIDGNNNVWVACSNSTAGVETRHVAFVNAATGQTTVYTNVGLHSIGTAVDSSGFAWVNSFSDGHAYKLNITNGNRVGMYPICDIGGTKPCFCATAPCTGCSCQSAAQSGPYTYSDMTGFSLFAIVQPAQGTVNLIHDTQCRANFNSITWTDSGVTATRTIRARARSAATQAGLAGAAWGPYVNKGGNPGIPANRFVEVQFVLNTDDSRETPDLISGTINFSYFPEVCDGIDNDCDGQVDEGFPNLGQNCSAGVGECVRSGIFVCAANQTSTVCNAVPGPPSAEICDGKDNNCNGQIDETFTTKGQPCTVGIGTCQNGGQWVCRPDGSGVQCSALPLPPSPEICDGLDNDCNGLIDDNLTRSCQNACGSGFEICQAGAWTACTARQPAAETCNNIDDDCDGQIDNGLTRPCSTACGSGNERCVAGQWVFCDAQKPKPEECNGLDDDCDGQIDNGLTPKPCTGACGEGTATCVNGAWGGCSGPQPKAEECNGKDDDCDGRIDNDVKRSCRTACGEGTETCTAGTWGACTAPQPSNEICDGKDNDCDGVIDNEGTNPLCPAGLVCHQGECRQRCRGNECPQGLRCENDICMGDPCKTVQCPADKRCVAGQCIDPCFLITCPQGSQCQSGKCVEDSCYTQGCPQGQRCVNKQCIPDPCQGVSCPSGQFCRDGNCVNSCTNVQCSSTQNCVDGQCVDNPTQTGPCQGVTCQAGQICQNGQCVGDPCKDVECPVGRLCRAGVCEHDPCVGIQCPTGSQCVVVQGTAQCTQGGNHPDGSNHPDGGNNPDGANNPDGTSSNPDGANNPDGTSSNPDGANNPENTSEGGQKEAGNTQGGNNNPDGEGGNRYQSPGCSCNLSPTQDTLWPLALLALLLLGLGYRRRRR